MSYPTCKSPQPIFFPVSLWKLGLLSVCTVGLYQVYWFYWNWRLIKQRERRKISPPWRSLIAVLFALPLFRRIWREASSGATHKALFLAAFAVWFTLTLVVYAPLPWAVLSLASVLPLLPVQAVANAVNARAAPGHDPNSRFRGWNIVALAVGGSLVGLNVLGLALYAA